MGFAGDHKSDGLASPALLRKIDQLREKNIGQDVPLPQVGVSAPNLSFGSANGITS